MLETEGEVVTIGPMHFGQRSRKPQADEVVYLDVTKRLLQVEVTKVTKKAAAKAA